MVDIGIGLFEISALLIGVGASFTIAGVINGRLSRRIRDTHRQKLKSAAQVQQHRYLGHSSS